MPLMGSLTPQTRPEFCFRVFQTGAMFGTGRGKKCGIRKNPLSNRKAVQMDAWALLMVGENETTERLRP